MTKPPRKGAAGRAGKPARAEPRAPKWRSPAALAVYGIALATLFLFRDVMLLGQAFLSPDATAPLGFVRVGEEALRHGIYPLWNPYIFCGMPSFASLAYNPFIYPPDLPVWLVTHVLPLPSTTWLVLYYFLAGLGAYLLCREWGAGVPAAVVAGVAFLSMPNLVAVGAHGHGSQLMDSAYIPWVLWLAARVFRRGRLSDVAWLALAIGFQLMRGHVQVCFYTWLALGLYLVVELAWGGADRPAPRVRAMRAAGVAAALGLGFALSAFLYLPVRDYAHLSIRGGGAGGGVGLDYATQWSFSPVEILTFFAPGAVGFGGPTYWGSMPFTDYPNYMGLGILLLAAVGAARMRRPRVVGFLLALSLFALLTSFGRNGFLYSLLYDHVPFFNKFRIPVMILVLLQLSVAVLAGFGLDAVLEARDGGAAAKRTRLALVVALGVGALVLLLGVAPDLWRGTLQSMAHASRPSLDAPTVDAALAGAAADAVRSGLLALLVLAAAWLCARRTLGAGLFLGAVLLFTAIDLWTVDQKLMQPVLGPAQAAAQANERDDVIDFLAQQSDSLAKLGDQLRILPASDQEFRNNRYAGFAIASLGGYHAAKPKLAQGYVDSMAYLRPFQVVAAGGPWQGDGFLNVSNTGYIVVPGLLPPAFPVELVHQGSQAVYRNPRALPRATLVGRAEVVPYDRQLARLTEPGYDPRAQVLLAEAPAGALGPAGGSVRITSYGLNTVAMETESPGPAILRFADLYDPDWTARVDGRDVPIWRADYCFRAVAVAAGRHRVEWKYESRALRLGLLLSGAALVAVGALFAAGVWRARGHPTGR